MKITPPFARLRKSVVDKNTLTGPYLRYEKFPVSAMLEVVLFQALVKNVVTLVLRSQFRISRIGDLLFCSRRVRLVFDTRIHNGDHLNALLYELLVHLLWPGEALRVPGKHAVTVHVVDVQVHYVERQIPLSVLTDNPFNHRIWVITPAALLISKRPQRRKRHVARQLCVPTEDLLYCRAVKKIVVHLAAFGSKPGALLRVAAKVEITAIAVIKENSVSRAAFQTKVKRNGLIDRIFSLGITRRIGIPINKRAAPLIESCGLFPQSIEVFIEAKFLRGCNEHAGCRIEHHSIQRALRVVHHWSLVCVNDVARVGITKAYQQW